MRSGCNHGDWPQGSSIPGACKPHVQGGHATLLLSLATMAAPADRSANRSEAQRLNKPLVGQEAAHGCMNMHPIRPDPTQQTHAGLHPKQPVARVHDRRCKEQVQEARSPGTAAAAHRVALRQQPGSQHVTYPVRAGTALYTHGGEGELEDWRAPSVCSHYAAGPTDNHAHQLLWMPANNTALTHGNVLCIAGGPLCGEIRSVIASKRPNRVAGLGLDAEAYRHTAAAQCARRA